MHYSPLRYPGGKNKLSAFIAQICIENDINGHYVEPYSGEHQLLFFSYLKVLLKKLQSMTKIGLYMLSGILF